LCLEVLSFAVAWADIAIVGRKLRAHFGTLHTACLYVVRNFRSFPPVQLVRIRILFKLHTRASVRTWRTTAVVAATANRDGQLF
jgi:hypothetical protein